MRRLTIEFSDKMSGVIKDLIGFGEAKTVAEVVRNSVGFYYIAKMEQKDGNRVAIVDGKGKIVKEIYMGM